MLNTKTRKLLSQSSVCNIYLHLTRIASISVFKVLKRSTKLWYPLALPMS